MHWFTLYWIIGILLIACTVERQDLNKATRLGLWPEFLILPVFVIAIFIVAIGWPAFLCLAVFDGDDEAR